MRVGLMKSRWSKKVDEDIIAMKTMSEVSMMFARLEDPE
jgi:hypothetical protein